MAFNISGNPLTCDFGSLADFNAALVEMNWDEQFIEIASIAWQSPATLGDSFILQNGYGVNVVNATCSAPNEDFYVPVNGSIHGLILTQLDSGNIAIYQRGK